MTHPPRGRSPRLTERAANYVRGVESFWPLLAFELNRVALIQCFIAVLLNCREVHEDVLTSGTLDKTVSFCSVEPLDHAVFLQANSLSDLFHAVYFRGMWRRIPQRTLIHTHPAGRVKQLHQLAYKTLSTMK